MLNHRKVSICHFVKGLQTSPPNIARHIQSVLDFCAFCDAQTSGFERNLNAQKIVQFVFPQILSFKVFSPTQKRNLLRTYHRSKPNNILLKFIDVTEK